jgi:hypothetical protein
MTLPRLWAFLAIALPTLAALIAAMSTVDLTYQLRAGAQILSGQGIPSVDTWTFTAAGQPWFDQQWGAQVILAAVYQSAGWTGLVANLVQRRYRADIPEFWKKQQAGEVKKEVVAA